MYSFTIHGMFDVETQERARRRLKWITDLAEMLPSVTIDATTLIEPIPEEDDHHDCEPCRDLPLPY